MKDDETSNFDLGFFENYVFSIIFDMSLISAANHIRLRHSSIKEKLSHSEEHRKD